MLYPSGALEDTETVVYPDQKTCLAAREEMAAPGIYLCLAYKDLPLHDGKSMGWPLAPP